MEELTAAQHLAIARDPARPNVSDYIQALFTDFFEQRGDRLCGEDPAILGGVALFHVPGRGRPWRRTCAAILECPARRATGKPAA